MLRGVETIVGLLLLLNVMGSGEDLTGAGFFSGYEEGRSRVCSAVIGGVWVSIDCAGAGEGEIVGSGVILSTFSGRGVVKKSVPRVPMGALGSSISWSLSLGLLTGNSIGVVELVATGRSSGVEGELAGGCNNGSFRGETSRRSAGLVPRPGNRTREDPLGEEPTAIPKSPEWLYLPVLGFGNIAWSNRSNGHAATFTLPVGRV